MKKLIINITCRLLNRLNRATAMLCIFFFSMALTACSSGNTDSILQINGTNTQADIKIEISLEDAISIGMKEASKHFDNLKLTEAHSYDNDDMRTIHAGEHGKRQWWYVDFANENLDYVSLLIVDNAVVDVHTAQEHGNNGLIEFTGISITAKEAVQRAKDLGMRGGDPDNEDDWASGFNFKLEYASLIDTPDDERVFFEVIGISPNGNFAHVDLDAVTGELLLAEEKFEYEDGSVEWKSFLKE